MIRPLGKISKLPIGKHFEEAVSLEEIWFDSIYDECSKYFFFFNKNFFTSNRSDIWNLGEYCREKQSEYKAKGIHSLSVSPPSGKCTPIETILSREQMFKEKNVITGRVHYKRHFFDTLPKVILHAYCSKNKLPQPIYHATRHDRQFSSIVTIQESQYGSVYWHKSAKYSSQAAALVACIHFGLYDKDFLSSIGCIRNT